MWICLRSWLVNPFYCKGQVGNPNSSRLPHSTIISYCVEGADHKLHTSQNSRHWWWKVMHLLIWLEGQSAEWGTIPLRTFSKAYLFPVTRKESPPACAMSPPQSKHLHLTALISATKVTGRGQTTAHHGLFDWEREGGEGGKSEERQVNMGKMDSQCLYFMLEIGS